MKLRPTQKDVAREAGVSHTAVSLALRSHHSIPGETRERILRVCRRLGYAPDPALSRLFVYRWGRRPPAYQSTLAYINAWPDPQMIHGSPRWDFPGYHSAACARANEHGYRLEEICLAEIDFNAKRLEKILKTRGITGLLLAPAPHARAELHIDYSRFSAVRLGCSFLHPHLHTVINAQFRTALATTEQVVAQGYRRPGLIIDRDQDERTLRHFTGGFLTGQQGLARSDRLAPFHPRGNDPQEIVQWIRRARPDAVMGMSRWSSLRAFLDGVGYADLSNPADESFVSGMHQNAMQIGTQAVDFLAAMLHRGETGIPDRAIYTSVESVWQPGKTLPPLSKKRAKNAVLTNQPSPKRI